MLKNSVDLYQNRTTTVVDFVFSLFFHHFHLYKFVFNNDKENNTTSQQLDVQTPPQNILALSEGIEKSAWDEQQALKNLETEHIDNIKVSRCN